MHSNYNIKTPLFAKTYRPQCPLPTLLPSWEGCDVGTGSGGRKWERGDGFLSRLAAPIAVGRGANGGPGEGVAELCADRSPPADPISS